MASITAHLSIAHRAMARLSVQEPGQFLLGAIAPDSVPSNEKDLTHYIERVSGRPYYRWEHFLDEYWHQAIPTDADFVLGYLCHLLADGAWDQHVRFPLRENPQFVGLGKARLPVYYEEISRIDILIRPDEATRREIAAQLELAKFPGIPQGLEPQPVDECVEWTLRDLFKEHHETDTRFIQPDKVEQMCRSAEHRTVEVATPLLAEMGR